MAVSTKKQRDFVYLSYNYRDGDRWINIYCGKKGMASTKKKLASARRQHYEARMRAIQDRFGVG